MWFVSFPFSLTSSPSNSILSGLPCATRKCSSRYNLYIHIYFCQLYVDDDNYFGWILLLWACRAGEVFFCFSMAQVIARRREEKEQWCQDFFCISGRNNLMFKYYCSVKVKRKRFPCHLPFTFVMCSILSEAPFSQELFLSEDAPFLGGHVDFFRYSFPYNVMPSK